MLDLSTNLLKMVHGFYFNKMAVTFLKFCIGEETTRCMHGRTVQWIEATHLEMTEEQMLEKLSCLIL